MDDILATIQIDLMDHTARVVLNQYDKDIASLSVVLKESRAYVRAYVLRGKWRKALHSSRAVREQRAELRQLKADRLRYIWNYVPKK